MTSVISCARGSSLLLLSHTHIVEQIRLRLFATISLIRPTSFRLGLAARSMLGMSRQPPVPAALQESIGAQTGNATTWAMDPLGRKALKIVGGYSDWVGYKTAKQARSLSDCMTLVHSVEDGSARLDIFRKPSGRIACTLISPLRGELPWPTTHTIDW